jgi:hypothetical protein
MERIFMNNIYYPLFTMVLLTLLVVLRPLYFNITAVIRKEVHIKHFKLFDEGIPPKLQSASQHYKNMFEMPILFYVLCVLLIINNNATSLDIFFAWGFVIFRILHSISRIPNRDVNLRFSLFAGSFIMLVAGWIHFAVKVV